MGIPTQHFVDLLKYKGQSCPLERKTRLLLGQKVLKGLCKKVMSNFNFLDPGQFLLLQRLATVPQKIVFASAKKMHVIRINSSIEVVYIWTIAVYLPDTLSGGYPWLSLVILCYH